MTSKTYSLGVDIGGTFTDIVLYGQDDARVYSHKELTTAQEPTDGAMRGVDILLQREQIAPAQISRVVHATTLFTNALIQRRGVRSGLITTAGFRDTLEMRREFKYDLYDLFIDIPQPLVPRSSRLEAFERVLADGRVDTALDEASVVRAADELVRQGVESIAVVFLHSYANPAHERRARELIVARHPGVYVSISSEVSPQIREYERTSTTVANAYVGPIADRYLRSLEQRLRDHGITCPLLMMLSNGGLAHVGEARRFPVQLLESGPAAGAIAAAYFSKRSGIQDVLAFDMGGTTAKLSIVEGNQPLVAHSFEAARQKRFAPGSGMPINISTVELIEIGAGGGSIAHVDSLGLLKVGPQSASSSPGPACYARGGTEPTVTDGNLVLGHLDATTFAGGTMRLDERAAGLSVSRLARELASDVQETAAGTIAVVNENMAAAARVHVAERGFDAPRFALLVTGGGGPLHGCDVARRLGIRTLLCPPGAGVASALGLLIAPARVDRSATLARQLTDIQPQALEEMYKKLEAEAQSVMQDTLLPGTPFVFERAADIRFVGQGFELVTQLPAGPYDANTPALIMARFASAYAAVFGQVPPVQKIELINLRVAAIESKVNRPLQLEGGSKAWVPGSSARQVWLPGASEAVAVPVFSREAMRRDSVIEGPALVEDASSTLWIPDGASAVVDSAGNLIVDLQASEQQTQGSTELTEQVHQP